MYKRVAVLVVLAAVAGCFSDRPDLDFGDVHGKVMLQGQPLANATVCFQPETGRPSYGRTDETGAYSLQYMGRPWGALVGKHTVSITTENRTENPDTGESHWQPEILPPKYHTQTELSAVVEAGENEIDFTLDEMKKGAKRP
ncbi:carboxypeptidase-like regulatory domain-containing protein [Bremerella sp. JC770]|uniref:carboxypeptidase-like regulatory domain-containing protein n=1 Tax=Bremerella sp. JC770 TaxID=3232137 RepID=UPI00345B4A01